MRHLPKVGYVLISLFFLWLGLEQYLHATGHMAGERQVITGTITDVQCTYGTIFLDQCTVVMEDGFEFRMVGVIAQAEYEDEEPEVITVTVEMRGFLLDRWVLVVE